MMSSSPASASERCRPSPYPEASPASRRAGSGTVRGMTTSVSYALKERVSSHIPNGSLSRSCNGPSG